MSDLDAFAEDWGRQMLDEAADAASGHPEDRDYDPADACPECGCDSFCRCGATPWPGDEDDYARKYATENELVWP